jgi:hypothetical protein
MFKQPVEEQTNNKHRRYNLWLFKYDEKIPPKIPNTPLKHLFEHLFV